MTVPTVATASYTSTAWVSGQAATPAQLIAATNGQASRDLPPSLICSVTSKCYSQRSTILLAPSHITAGESTPPAWLHLLCHLLCNFLYASSKSSGLQSRRRAVVPTGTGLASLCICLAAIAHCNPPCTLVIETAGAAASPLRRRMQVLLWPLRALDSLPGVCLLQIPTSSSACASLLTQACELPAAVQLHGAGI